MKNVKSTFGLGLIAIALTAALFVTAARAQLTPPEDQYKYKACLRQRMTPGQTVSVPVRCAKRGEQTMIVLQLKGGVASASMRVSGLGEFRVSGRQKRLRVAVGTRIALLRVSSLGGPGGVILTVLDYSKPIPVGSVWDDDDDPTNPNRR